MRALFLLCLLVLPLPAGSIRVLPWDHGIATRTLGISYGNKTLPLENLHPSARSAPVEVPEAAEGLRLIDLKRLGEDGKPLGVALKIPAGTRRPLLILVPDKKAPLRLRPLVIEDHPASFRWGSFSFLNFTGKELVVSCEKKAILLPASKQPTSHAPGGSSRNLAVKVFLRDRPEKALYASYWEHKAELRQLVIVVPQEGLAKDGPINFKHVVEDRRDVEQP